MSQGKNVLNQFSFDHQLFLWQAPLHSNEFVESY